MALAHLGHCRIEMGGWGVDKHMPWTPGCQPLLTLPQIDPPISVVFCLSIWSQMNNWNACSISLMIHNPQCILSFVTNINFWCLGLPQMSKNMAPLYSARNLVPECPWYISNYCGNSRDTAVVPVLAKKGRHNTAKHCQPCQQVGICQCKTSLGAPWAS
jgi:hypothetical protein